MNWPSMINFALTCAYPDCGNLTLWGVQLPDTPHFIPICAKHTPAPDPAIALVPLIAEPWKMQKSGYDGAWVEGSITWEQAFQPVESESASLQMKQAQMAKGEIFAECWPNKYGSLLIVNGQRAIKVNGPVKRLISNMGDGAISDNHAFLCQPDKMFLVVPLN